MTLFLSADLTIVHNNMEALQNTDHTLLKIPEVARILRLHRASVYHMIKRKALPAVRLGRMIRVKSSDLQQFIN